jgi:hypothetical protein
MNAKQPQLPPPPKNKFSAANDFERGVVFGLFRRGGLDEDTPIWRDGYNWAKDFKDGMYAAMNLSLESHGYQPIGVIRTQEKQPTSPPPPRKR